jgi:hypothetical protein
VSRKEVGSRLLRKGMTDEDIIAYLLKELQEDRSEQFEEECFAQEVWPSRIESVEEDLIDAYLRGELTPQRQRLFEDNYLITPERRERVAVAAALLRLVEERRPAAQSTVKVSPLKQTWMEWVRVFRNGQSWPLLTAAALGIIAIMAGTVWLARSDGPSRQTIAAVSLPISRDNNRAEGTEASKIKLPLDTDALEISLRLPEQSIPADHYRVEMLNENGETKSLAVTGQDAQSVWVITPSAELHRGQYAFHLFAAGADSTEQRVSGSYFLTVE